MTALDTDALTLVFKALANPTRLRILGWLKDPEYHFSVPSSAADTAGVCVKQIQEKAGVSQSTASQFMAHLERAGLVVSHRFGQWTYYERNEARIAEITRQLGATL